MTARRSRSGAATTGCRCPPATSTCTGLGDLADEDPALLADYVDDRRVAFVEWPEVARRGAGPRVAARVTLEHAGDDRRRVTVRGRGDGP